MYSLYVIVNLLNNKLYIGKTNQPLKRKKRHFNDLKLKKHHSILLQRAYDKYGVDNFEFCIVLEDIDFVEINNIEEKYIRLFGDYNVSLMSSGGDLISNHPNYEELCKQKSITSKLFWKNLTQIKLEEIKENKRGDKNPMYGKNHSIETKNKMSEKHYSKKDSFISHLKGKPKSETTKQKISKANKNKKAWNKGKIMGELSNETKLKISTKLKGRRVESLEKKVYCEGVVFDSLTQASKHYNISVAGMLVRVKSGSEKMKNFYYI